jgi:hypothetical protein
VNSGTQDKHVVADGEKKTDAAPTDEKPIKLTPDQQVACCTGRILLTSSRIR